MADIEIKINQQSLYLPEGFKLPWEGVNPSSELATIILGDYSMDINLPLAQNETILNNSARIELENRDLVYDCDIYHFGRIVVKGVALLNGGSLTEINLATIRMSFLSNAFGIESYKVTLAEALAGETTTLGNTTDAIIIAAEKFNTIPLSADGATGSIMRFPITFNPDFYGESNPDWYPNNPQAYDPKKTYEEGDAVLHKYTTNTVLQYSQPNYGPREYLVVAKESILEDETPETMPEKWDIRIDGLINSWDSIERDFRVNAEYDPLLGAANRYNIVPYFQLHHIIRKLFEAYGYTISGSFMSDPLRRQMLVYSNYALDKLSPKPGYCRLGIENYDLPNGLLIPIPLETTPAPFEDANGRWDGAKYTVHKDGYVAFKGMAEWTSRTPGAGIISVLISLRFVSPSLYIASWSQAYATYNETVALEMDHVVKVTAGDQLEVITTHDAGTPAIINFADVSFRHLGTDAINMYEGKVSLSDHVPDIEVVDFLRTLRIGFNLKIELDPITKQATLNYDEDSYDLSNTPDDFTAVAARTYKPKYEQLRRFRFYYGNLPQDTYAPPSTHTILDPVNKYQDLPAPTNVNAAIFVKQRNAWFTTQNNFRAKEVFWEYAGQHYPAVEVGTKGDLVEIAPAMGPMSLRRMKYGKIGEAWSVAVNEVGRSPVFNPGGARPSLRIVYSYSNGWTAGSPYDFAGEKDSAMNWVRIHKDHYKKTLETLAREERVELLAKLPLAQLINPNWQKFKIINGVLYKFLTQKSEFGANDMVVIDMRKIKTTALQVIESTNGKLSGGAGGSSQGQLYHFLGITPGDPYIPSGYPGYIQQPTERSYPIVIHMPFAGTIEEIYGETEDGTATFKLKKGGADVTGSTLNATTTITGVVPTANNAFQKGDRFDLIVTAVSTTPEAVGLSFALVFTQKVD